MNRFMLAFFAFVALLVGLAVRVSWTPANASPSLRELPMTEAEEQAATGIGDRAQLIQEAIARVSSDNQTRKHIREIAMAWGALMVRSEKLARSAAHSRGLDVALVQSGSAWVIPR